MSKPKSEKATSAKRKTRKIKNASWNQQDDDEKPESPFLSFRRFWLPGDPDESPPPPEYFEGWVNLCLQNLAGRKEERWGELERVIWASSMASNLIRWLFSCAWHGDEAAQGQAADVAREATRCFIILARKEVPGLMPRVRLWPELPGWISISPEVAKGMESLCKQLKQGEQFPFPLSQEGKQGKPLKITEAHHSLVDALHGYIEGYRRAAVATLGDGFLIWSKEYHLHPLVLKMLKMPPLSCATTAEWRAMAKEVLLDSANGNPLEHPAFKPGGKYESLGTLDRRGEPNLWKRWREAWQLRSVSMERLPVDSPPRK